MRSTDGATALEFALVAPMLFLIMMGIVELGLVFFTYAVLEGATGIGSRIGKTGYTSGGLSREDYIRKNIQDLSGGLLDLTQLKIEILTYSDFSNVGKPEPCILPPAPPCPGVKGTNYVDINNNNQWDADMGKSGAGGAGEVVLYRVTYPWTFFTPMMTKIFADPQTHHMNITAIATVRNEPI